MKRFFLVLSVILAAAGTVFSQDNPYRPVFGFRAAVDVNLPGNWNTPVGASDVFNVGAGGAIGFACRFPFMRDLYVEPAVNLYYDQYSFKNKLGTTNYGNVNTFGVRIPFVLGYNFRFSEKVVMTVFTGPEFKAAFAGSYSDGPVGENPYNSSLYNLRHFNVAWNVGIGVPVKNFMISVEGSFGMTDQAQNSLYSFRENRITAGLTYYF